MVGNSLAVQWLGLRAPSAGGPGSIPGRGTRSACHMVWPKTKNKNKTKPQTNDQKYQDKITKIKIQDHTSRKWEWLMERV